MSTAAEAAVRALLSERRELFAEPGPSPDAARRSSDAADRALRALAASAPQPPGRWSLVALGGYGAGRLLPGSDLDLLLVSGARADRLRPFAEALLYPLWDAGLAVGHQVRAAREHVRACRDDLETLTASLTGRVVAGDAGLGTNVLAEPARRAQADRTRVLRRLATRPRPGSPYLLEPDLKEGAGGRRDLDELAWTAAVLSGVPASDPAPLVPLGLLRVEEYEALRAAETALTALRWRLHLAGPRTREVLTLDASEDCGLAPGEPHEALATVAHTLARVRRRVAGATGPSLPATGEELLAALGAGEEAIPLLEEAVWAGVLEPLLPGMRELTHLRRPGLSHTLTVGAHCLTAAALVADTPSRDPFAAEALDALADRRPLLAAALTHDAGKRKAGPGHAARGRRTARALARELGAKRGAVDDAGVLAAEHLLLAETAIAADIADEDVLLRAAARVGDRDLVGPLYVLTLADTLATSPGAWTPWRAALTRELASRLDAALSPAVEGAGIARAAEETRAKALAMLASTDERGRGFVERAPLRYLATAAPALVALHADLAAPLVGSRDPAAVAVAVTPGPLPATWRVTVATPDRPGLFALLAGVFALSGLSILDADAMAGPGGTAIDVFTVETATGAAADTSTWAMLDRTLRAALAGRLELEVRLAERRRHYRPRGAAFPPSVETDASAGYTTSLRVRAPDRVGLLHDLALALSAAGLDIRSASVFTHDNVALDIFRVVDAAGEPPADPALLARVADALRDAGQTR